MTREEMRRRTKAYANRVVKLCSALPANWVAQTLGKQLLRSGTSVGANYEEAQAAESKADFVQAATITKGDA